MRIGRALALAVMAALTACGGSVAAPGGPGGRTLEVVAAENFWGSLAGQLGGGGVTVRSIVTDPNADPHEYESSSRDARALAGADLVILNGAGYDDWAVKLLDANPNPGRRVLDVAGLLGKRAGDNPHFWYDPAAVESVADRISSLYASISPSAAARFRQRRVAFQGALGPYLARIAEIRHRFGGTPIGATESVFVYMAAALGLDLVSPAELMQAVAEGNDPPAGAVAVFSDQITRHQVRVLVYNVQTATQVTTNLKHQAAAAGIPVVGMSETLRPRGVTFQDWQLAQLLGLENALDGRRPVA